MTQEFFTQAAVYLLAALIAVPLARRLGLGSVLGYLIGGLVIGPWGLRLVGEEGEQVQHFAEFGVVMMLFLVGLELEPSRLWKMRLPIFGLGGAQVLGTAAIVALAATVLGTGVGAGVALGLIVAMSSTAIALQSLAERGMMRSDAGEKSFAVLLFQDLAVIPILAILPLLATATVDHGAGHAEAAGGHGSGGGLLEGAPAWVSALAALGAVLAVVASGRLLVRPLMRRVAGAGLRELFTAAALLLVVGVALLMTIVGLSPALGTFLAGVVLAESEYRHELESDIEPFKGLLLGLFFLAVGSSIDVGVVLGAPVQTFGLLAGVLLLKGVFLYGIARIAGSRADQAAMFAASLAGVGEFAFVLLGFAERGGTLDAGTADTMVAVTALSMAASPLLLVATERLILPRLVGKGSAPEREADKIDEENAVIIAGFGRFGQITGRFLRANGVPATVVDVDSEQVDVLRQFGNTVHYGDASRLDLLRAAGAERAKILVIAVDTPEKVVEIAHTARRHFPNLAILARARGRVEAYDLIDLGAEGVYRETFDTALRTGTDALRLLGYSGHRALRAAQTFRKHDEAGLLEMAAHRNDQERLVTTARERIRMLELALKDDIAEGAGLLEDGWDSDELRAAVRKPEAGKDNSVESPAISPRRSGD